MSESKLMTCHTRIDGVQRVFSHCRHDRQLYRAIVGEVWQEMKMHSRHLYFAGRNSIRAKSSTALNPKSAVTST